MASLAQARARASESSLLFSSMHREEKSRQELRISLCEALRDILSEDVRSNSSNAKDAVAHCEFDSPVIRSVQTRSMHRARKE